MPHHYGLMHSDPPRRRDSIGPAPNPLLSRIRRGIDRFRIGTHGVRSGLLGRIGMTPEQIAEQEELRQYSPKAFTAGEFVGAAAPSALGSAAGLSARGILGLEAAHGAATLGVGPDGLRPTEAILGAALGVIPIPGRTVAKDFGLYAGVERVIQEQMQRGKISQQASSAIAEMLQAKNKSNAFNKFIRNLQGGDEGDNAVIEYIKRHAPDKLKIQRFTKIEDLPDNVFGNALKLLRETNIMSETQYTDLTTMLGKDVVKSGTATNSIQRAVMEQLLNTANSSGVRAFSSLHPRRRADFFKMVPKETLESGQLNPAQQAYVNSILGGGSARRPAQTQGIIQQVTPEAAPTPAPAPTQSAGILGEAPTVPAQKSALSSAEKRNLLHSFGLPEDMSPQVLEFFDGDPLKLQNELVARSKATITKLRGTINTLKAQGFEFTPGDKELARRLNINLEAGVTKVDAEGAANLFRFPTTRLGVDAYGRKAKKLTIRSIFGPLGKNDTFIRTELNRLKKTDPAKYKQVQENFNETRLRDVLKYFMEHGPDKIAANSKSILKRHFNIDIDGLPFDKDKLPNPQELLRTAEGNIPSPSKQAQQSRKQSGPTPKPKPAKKSKAPFSAEKLEGSDLFAGITGGYVGLRQRIKHDPGGLKRAFDQIAANLVAMSDAGIELSKDEAAFVKQFNKAVQGKK